MIKRKQVYNLHQELERSIINRSRGNHIGYGQTDGWKEKVNYKLASLLKTVSLHRDLKG